LTVILQFKKEFDRRYFAEVQNKKLLTDKYLEIIRHILEKFRHKHFENEKLRNEISLDSISSSNDDSSLNENFSSPKKIVKKEKENFEENLDKFERIIDILISITPEDMFKEVKSLILNEYENITNDIKTYLGKDTDENNKKFLSCISSNILFIISTITYKIDYYTITINWLVEKLNKFLIDFVEGASDVNEFVKSLDLVEKFVKIKKTYIKDFIENKDKILEEKEDNLVIVQEKEIRAEKNHNNFAFNKFCSFGRYFFNNLFSLIDTNINLSNFEKKNSGKEFDFFNRNKTNIYKKKYIQDLNFKHFFFRRYSLRKAFGLDKYFREFFNAKIANWKYSTILPGIKKIEICRICETTFEINEFVLHLYFCKEIKMNSQRLVEVKFQIKNELLELKNYRE
jgi:hypothetical protein